MVPRNPPTETELIFLGLKTVCRIWGLGIDFYPIFWVKMPTYVLEAQRYITCDERAYELNGRFEHVGYMQRLFGTKGKACKYYDVHNPHMRSMNAHGTNRSDWDPETKLRYVARQYSGECLTLSGFNA